MPGTGTKILMWSGYLAIHVGREHHLAMANGMAYEHRLVAEEKIGRRLRPGECVHHINGVKTDNRPENLEVCPSTHHHRRKHARNPDMVRGPDEPNSRVDCECGCGRLIWKYDAGGARRRFSVGHATRIGNPLIPCACGCGGLLTEAYVLPGTTQRHRKRRYIKGHNLHPRHE